MNTGHCRAIGGTQSHALTMFSTPWVCSRCIARPVRLLRGPRLFYQRRRLQTDSDLSPALVVRAQNLASEHATLSDQLATSFDPRIAKRMGELGRVTKALEAWNNANKSISELKSLLDDPDSETELRSLAIEEMETTKATLTSASDELKRALVPRHPFADLPCMLEIRPGAGGDEASIFAFELLNMYIAFCANRGMRSAVIKRELADSRADALDEAVLEIEAAGAYDILRTEAGVHRVQRVPATESKGRTHTSAVSVMVLPSFPDTGAGEDSALNFDDPSSDWYIDPQEVRAEKMRARGAGGQHVNKTESAIRLTHIPTGLVVSMQDSRSQHANRKKAWQILRAKIAETRQAAREQELVELRRGALGGIGKMDRGDKVRTYNYGQNRCTDHRSGCTIHNLENVLDGGESLETVMDNVRSWLTEREIMAIASGV
ncbi:putative mitochondrial translation release factor (RF-1) [Aspergillus stella-maris]|uniref:putative mitochondrial translation release factor (RF-1) n=1 Tax=Aspergillus stella-maris TaxID=1810926 RepID=UPI003CCE17B1